MFMRRVKRRLADGVCGPTRLVGSQPISLSWRFDESMEEQGMLATDLNAALDPEAYLALERAAETKSEYIDGQMVAMSGASVAHVRVTRNILTRLSADLEGAYCEALGPDLRVQARTDYFYPDVTVICGPLELGGPPADTLQNPTVIFEVLSPSTEQRDRTVKFRAYRRIPSLQAYVLVAQDQAWVDCFRRQGDVWVFSSLVGLEEVLDLPEIGCRLTLAEIYERVDVKEVVEDEGDEAPVMG